MIARIEGMVVLHDGSMVVIDCGGVGYGVIVASDEQALMKNGDKVTLWVAESIKEDSYDLFGFMATSRRNLFRQLLSVNGVGPKAAMAILSLGAEGEVRAAVAGGDVKFLSSATGVGKKVAERVIVDLKNKVGLDTSASATNFLAEAAIGDADEAVQALVALGYSPVDAKEALAKIDPSLSLEGRVSAVLRGQ